MRIEFNEPLAHRIEAGGDVFLMPSRFEPCGLNQLYSLRYGTVPVVHATGGLDDTVIEFDPVAGTGTGFKFTPYTVEAFLAAAGHALRLHADPAAWQRLMRNGMAQDFSWHRAARAYARLYATLPPPESPRLRLLQARGLDVDQEQTLRWRRRTEGAEDPEQPAASRACRGCRADEY